MKFIFFFLAFNNKETLKLCSFTSYVCVHGTVVENSIGVRYSMTFHHPIYHYRRFKPHVLFSTVLTEKYFTQMEKYLVQFLKHDTHSMTVVYYSYHYYSISIVFLCYNPSTHYNVESMKLPGHTFFTKKHTSFFSTTTVCIFQDSHSWGFHGKPWLLPLYSVLGLLPSDLSKHQNHFHVVLVWESLSIGRRSL